MTDLRGQAILITGGSTGIGAASARLAAAAGADVALTWATHGDAAEAVRADCEAHGGRAIALECNVTDPAQVEQAVRQTLGAFGRLDVCFANAGALVRRSPIVDTSDALFDEVMKLNVYGVFYTARAALRPMLEAGRGHIIVNASVAARTGGGGGSVHYAAAKGAVVSFVRGLAREVASGGLRVNAIAPGVTDTPFHEKFTEPERMQAFRKKIPLGRPGTPEEIARCFVWLCGETEGFITGETVYLTGGV